MATETNNLSKLSVDINSQVFNEFQKQWKARGQVRNRAVQAAIKFWIELPIELQAKLLDDSLDGSSFIAVVQQIADERIEAGRKAAESFVKRRKRNKTQKD
jgi:hypothetical protein